MAKDMFGENLAREIFKSYEVDLEQLEKYLGEIEDAMKRNDPTILKVYNSLVGYYLTKVTNEMLHIPFGNFLYNLIGDEEFRQSFNERLDRYTKKVKNMIVKVERIESKILQKVKENGDDLANTLDDGLIPPTLIVEILNREKKEVDEKVDEERFMEELISFFGKETFERIEENSKEGYL